MPTESKPVESLPTRLTVSQAASMAGVNRRTMLRRLRAIDRRCGGRVLTWYGVGRSKLWVDSKELLIQLRSPSAVYSDKLGVLHARLEELDRRVTALRGAHRGLSDRFELAEKNRLAFQTACAAALQGIGTVVTLAGQDIPGQNATDPTPHK